MKHVFIINPTAGKKDCTAHMMDMAKTLAARHSLDLDCILTKSAGHAMETARNLARSGREVRLYACGGDGTINEVANGIAGCDSAAMTCIPVGTGNDFLKNFGDMAQRFSDAENLWDGPVISLDTIDCNGRLALTVACSGFDAQVADDVHKYGKVPLLGGQGSYILSLGVNFLLRSLGHKWTIILDGKAMPGEYALAAVCNGRYYGGGFMPVAEARMDDGVLNTLIVEKVSRPTFLRFVGAYSKGLYYTLPDVAKCYTAREIVIESRDKDIVTCLDGESVYNRKVCIRLSEKKVRFFGPEGCDPNATYVSLPKDA
ncbi:MAG: BmrU protein [Oscillospiraceae bacterium]|nr:BmrU protein [Oscillospiraceae bacterium]